MSWQLLVVLCDDLSEGCMLVTTMRENDGVLNARHYQAEDKLNIHRAVMDTLEALQDVPDMNYMCMGGFDRAETQQLMASMLPGIEIHDSNVEEVFRQTNGNPAHVEQISYYLESGGDTVNEALARPNGLITSNLAQVAASGMPHIVLSRVDWLRPGQQLTLKVCSVLGPTVRFRLLQEMYPLREGTIDQKQLLDDLAALSEDNFLEAPSVQQVWDWQSEGARDIVYNMIPDMLRSQLHARLAAALEATGADVHPFPMSHIAYHWTKSCQGRESEEVDRTMNAVRCWIQAAQSMDRQGQFLDAVQFASKSIDLCEKVILARRAGSAPAQTEPNAFTIAEQYKFKADVYFKLVMESEQVRSCTRYVLHVANCCGCLCWTGGHHGLEVPVANVLW